MHLYNSKLINQAKMSLVQMKNFLKQWNITSSNELEATLLAGLPCHVPGKCGGSRLQACPKGKHELKEL
jgi:hypothetical protein